MLVVRLILSVVGVRISARLTADVTTDQRHLLSDAYLRTSWAVQQAEPAGRLQELLTSFVGRVTNAVTTLTVAVTAALSLVAFLGVGFAVDPLATSAVLVALAVVVCCSHSHSQARQATVEGGAQANLAFANAVSELGSLGLEIQTFGVQKRFADRIDALTRETTDAQRTVLNLASMMSPLYMSLAYAAVLAGVAVATVVGFDNLEVIGGVMLLMLRSLSDGQQLATASGSLAASAPFLERVSDTVNRYEASPASHGEVVPPGVMPLEARDVQFAYAAGRHALTDVSFRIDKGEAVGAIGPSGAGKSTLAQLLLGLRAPTSGTLTAGGLDLRVIDRSWWSERVAFVAQDALLFTGTVAENIRFSGKGSDDAALRRAAKQAMSSTTSRNSSTASTRIWVSVAANSQVGSASACRLPVPWSGSPSLWSWTSPHRHWTGRAEALVRNSLADLHGRITVVIIAHRMSTLDLCDRIMVIESEG